MSTERRWQYKVVRISSGLTGLKPEALEETLAPLGLQGWELVSVAQISVYAYLYLKKEQ